MTTDPERTRRRGLIRRTIAVTKVAIKSVAAREQRDGLLVLGLVSLLAGAGAGLIGAAFRLGLIEADRLRNLLIGWAQGESAVGFVLVVAGCAAGAGIAAWMVRRFAPPASGSGIPQVEA
ncbi:MAG: hypothetical protein ACREFZ_06280, partial [Acetobacteraceae bacterium]